MNHCLLKMYGTLKINVNHSKTEPSRNRGCSSRPDGGCSVPDHSGRHQSQVTLWHYDEADRLTHRTVHDEEAERWQYNERGWLTATVTAVATATIITTITSTVWRTTAAGNRVLHCWNAATCMTRWAAGSGKAAGMRTAAEPSQR